MVNLRDSLLATLKSLPGAREFHIHVLVSSPRKDFALFHFAHPRPRSYLQDILILLSEQTTPDSPRIFVSAIEASIYNLPSTSCGILYISKVDTTGQGIQPSPAAVLVRSLITFYCDPATRPIAVDHLWVHLFARAQGQYLFPNSSEYAGKRPLTDTKLCAWWKRLLADVAKELDTRAGPKARIKLYYVLPGYSEMEAINALKVAPTSASWTYGHPYSQSDIPLPCPMSSGNHNLGHFIPSFNDDPKSRFMDEIAYTTDKDGVVSPRPKRPKTTHGDVSSAKFIPADGEKDRKDDQPLGELGKVMPDEFWERMSFRQECVAGAVTGFFTMAFSLPYLKEPTRLERISPLEAQNGQVSSQINKRIMTTLVTGVEFSTVERSIRGTETVESAIKGLCEGLATKPAPAVRIRPVLQHSRGDSGRQTPERDSSELPEPPHTPPRRQRLLVTDISPNPFPEPIASLETYDSYIYGTVTVSNPGLEVKAVDEKAGLVTVLTARKKKKKN